MRFCRPVTASSSLSFCNKSVASRFSSSSSLFFTSATTIRAMSSSSTSTVDPSSMKISDLKAEIESLGATDKLFQGMEKADLIEVLVNARKNPTTSAASASDPTSATASLAQIVKQTFPNAERRAANLRYGQFALVGNKTNPTALVTFCHGLGDTCAGWAQGMEYELAPNLRHCLFMLPTAATQPVSMNMGYAMPAWYDIKGLGDRATEDPEGVAISSQFLEEKAVETAEKYKIDKNRIALCGFSQGAALSLSLGLTTRAFKPAGLGILSGYLAARDFVIPNIVNGDVPIQQFHGTADPMVNIDLAHKSKETLEASGKVKNILPIKTYRGMQHSSDPKEMADLVQFLDKVLPAKY